MENTNEMTIIFDSYSSNEAFARVAVAAFMTSLNPTVEEVADVKTAVSEAVTRSLPADRSRHHRAVPCEPTGRRHGFALRYW